MPHQLKNMDENLQQYEQLISTLPCSEGSNMPLCNYHGFWLPKDVLPAQLAFCDKFKPRDTDILLVSQPKSGTTWLKSLAFATVNRKDHSPFALDHPLLHSNPHDCVPFIEAICWKDKGGRIESSSMLLSTHLPYSILPESMKSPSCKLKIIYICRDPKDVLVSGWHFHKQFAESGKTNNKALTSFEEKYEMYCNGVSNFGPVWDHNLEYWRESLNRPEKVLFLKYEDLKVDTLGNLMRLAEFLGYPFSEEEEKEGVLQGIVKLCGIENMKSLEVNQKGQWGWIVPNSPDIKNSSFFRKGMVGDWRNHLSPEMAQRLDEITREKLHGSGLSFESTTLPKLV